MSVSCRLRALRVHSVVSDQAFGILSGVDRTIMHCRRLPVAHMAGVDAKIPVSSDSHQQLSAHCDAIGHGNNMVLGGQLPEHGPNMNDNESIYGDVRATLLEAGRGLS